MSERSTGDATDEAQGVNLRAMFGGMIPEPAGLGIIKSLASLAEVLEKDGIRVLKFDAGLPDHKRGEKIKAELKTNAADDFSDYPRYPRRPGAITEKEVLKSIRDYHREVVGIDSPENRFALTEGSTPALNHLIRMQALQKARTDGKRLGENCVLEQFEFTYPLYRIPAEHVGMEITSGIKLETEIDVQDGKPIQSMPWQLNRPSLSASFEKNRDKIAVFAFSNPANPSGYKLSQDEMHFLAGELLNDFRIRRYNSMPPKLVLEDIAYLTMMHDDKDRPYTLVHAFDTLIEQEKKKPSPDKALITDLRTCKETVLTVHSLSKAAAEAGDRVAYTEGNPVLIEALRETYMQDMLSHANPQLFASRGAFDTGKPDRKVMQQYSERVQALETGMNGAFFAAAEQEGLQLTKEQIQNAMPFPNRSSGSFFTIMNLKPLLGQKVDQATLDKIHDYIGRIDNEGIRNCFGPLFKNGTLNDETDLSLYFMFKTLEYGDTAVTCVPLMNSGGRVRFSMGMTPVEDVNAATAAAHKFFTQDPTYRKALAGQQQKTPGNAVDTIYRINAQGVTVAVAR